MIIYRSVALFFCQSVLVKVVLSRQAAKVTVKVTVKTSVADNRPGRESQVVFLVGAAMVMN